jgi:hypothetical protein
MSEENAREWLHLESFEGTYFDNGACHIVKAESDSPNYSPEVHVAAMKILTDSVAKGIQVPFTIEVLDSKGRLFKATEVRRQGHQLRGSPEIFDCAHLTFPVTVKLVGHNGLEIAELVEHQQ